MERVLKNSGVGNYSAWHLFNTLTGKLFDRTSGRC